MNCPACTCALGGVCARHEDAAEQLVELRRERRGERLYGDQAEARAEAIIYGEAFGNY